MLLKLWCWRRILSLLDCKEIHLVNPKATKSWIFIGRTDAEAPILWPPDEKNWLIGKYAGAGKDWRQEEKGMTEDEMVGWHHRLNEFEQAPEVGDRQGGLACCSPWGHRESDTTEWLNWTFYSIMFTSVMILNAYHPLMRMNLVTVNLTLISFDKLYHSSEWRILSVQKVLILNFTLVILYFGNIYLVVLGLSCGMWV